MSQIHYTPLPHREGQGGGSVIMDKFELQRLRDLPIEGVAERLGLQVSRHKCLCPFHDDHHASLSFSVRRNTYRCFACGAHGSVIDLAMGLLHKPFLDACRWLAEGASLPCPLPEREREFQQKERPFDVQRYARYFEHPFLNEEARRFLFAGRRLHPEVIRYCRLTSWRDKEGTPWLQIPYFDPDGRLVGIQNRNLMPEPKQRFLFPAGSECVLYNQPVLRLLRPGEPLYITEGCSDCWAMLSAGHKAVAIPSATLFKPRDVQLLCAIHDELATPFHMYPDRDLPGEHLFLQLQHALPNLEHHHLPPDCKDFSEYFNTLTS